MEIENSPLTGAEAEIDSEDFQKEETPAVSEEQNEIEDGLETETEKEEGSEEQSADPAEPGGSKKKEESHVLPGVQKRINKLTYEKNQALREAEVWKRKFESSTPVNEPAPEAPPTLESFDFDEEKYNAALVKYEVKKATASIKEELLIESIQKKKQQRNKEFAQKIQKANIPGYYETAQELTQTVIFPPETVDVIQDDENGPHIVDYLGKHLDVADRIASLPPLRAASEIGKISVQLENLKKKKPTKTPNPPKRLSGGGSPLKKNLEDMSLEEILADDTI